MATDWTWGPEWRLNGLAGCGALFQQGGLCVARFLTAGGFDAAIFAVLVQHPGLGVVGEIEFQAFLHDPVALGLIVNRETHLDALEEITIHPIGTGKIQVEIALVVEIEHAGVFQEAADDRTHLDILGYTRHARA